MNIHRLKDTIINRIAAGEVVERPASVVKELVENAIDAGADRIEITTAGGGKNLIRVHDNGSGIAANELELAVSRHCTSKMADNIHDIRSLGFRGEALPSIASVAHLRLASRAGESTAGAEITVAGGRRAPVRPAAIQSGTVVEVRDLFYATPARLKFLKSDQAEAAAISDNVKRLAIAFPHIRFSLSGTERLIIDLPAAPLFAAAAQAAAKPEAEPGNEEDIARAQAYHSRLIQILGRDFAENSVGLNARRENVHIFGFIGIPSYHRGNALHQFAYVNGRPVRDKIISAALRAAYADMLPAGRHAVAALFLQLDPAHVDVNVHPAKADVRFRDAGLIRGLIIGAIRQVLEQAGARPATTAAAALIKAAEANRQAGNKTAYQAYEAAYYRDRQSETAPFIKAGNKAPVAFAAASGAYPAGRGRITGFAEDPAPWHETEDEIVPAPAAPLLTDNKASAPALPGMWPQPFPPAADFRLPEDNQDEAEADEQHAAMAQFPLGAAKAQIHQNYIIAQTENSLIIVDQHAAHERLVYEALKQALYAEPLASQMLLIPEIIELPPEDIARLLSHAEFLQKFGLVFEPFGNHALAVRETPALLGQINVQKLMRDLADEAAEHDTAGGLKDRLDYVAATMACHGSVRSGRRLKPQEMNALLRQMEQVPQSGTCNHGRPTFIELKLTDIEKLFARR
ncbi:DNA mismatch repair endonuclease MutL [Candidatus Tokpelaia sp.]|uniref:DNA mismatch repair endonuclease MutL n=1 Tax=Candidatus Tokpelaia sp. TaxID=2233777 RepID=UPI0012396F02|nr:DNA mismatch repair endonuclease MutL [Candidatus Tokpelaia sp.]KAA6404656.1 DNA mismatch repair endonuclease MutL [Candidatus Tokpelaia sp.]